MKIKVVIILLVTLLVLSCKKEYIIQQRQTAVSTHANFKQFISKFKKLQLPLTIETLQIDEEKATKLNVTDFKYLGINEASPELNSYYAYGILPDTTTTYKVIYFAPAEIYIPVLVTFTKQGKKISKTELGVGGCGSDCGFTCKEFITIDKNQKIYSVDSIQSYECDSLGIIANTLKKYATFKKGKIDKNGKILMSNLKESNY